MQKGRAEIIADLLGPVPDGIFALAVRCVRQGIGLVSAFQHG